mmetsp:Transcript_98708/g.318302  ORF Transcript_98708/g.318302 Transcript_98708/m.318302 type:complete len:601 (-) Transcript_98708:102-1904(-)
MRGMQLGRSRMPKAGPKKAELKSNGHSNGHGNAKGIGDAKGMEASTEKAADALVLPNTPEVRKQVAGGGCTITFLSVAVGIVTRLEEELEATRGEELRFVRACLAAGHEQTQVPCALDEDEGEEGGEEAKPAEAVVRRNLRRTYTTAKARGSMLRKDAALRGAFGPCRAELDAATLPGEATGSAPWMGPVVPRWPTTELTSDLAAKLDRQFKEDFHCMDFDVFAVSKLTSGRTLQFVGWEALCHSGCFSHFSLDAEKACHFLQCTEKQYASSERTPYHNNIHAADVTQTVHALLMDIGLGISFDPMDKLVSIFSAIIHDMGHDGRNNAFHVNMQDEVALLYNDRSVLENYHVSSAFKLVAQSPETNLFGDLGKAQLTMVRRETVDMVLSTDMAYHFARVGNFGKLVKEMGNELEKWYRSKEAMDELRSVVLHAADISNPAKPFPISLQWTERCLREFFEQGDAEKGLGLPISPLCDRDGTSIPRSQIGFIEFIVQPTFEALAEVAPKVHTVCLHRVRANVEMWRRREREEECLQLASPDTESVEADERVAEAVGVYVTQKRQPQQGQGRGQPVPTSGKPFFSDDCGSETHRQDQGHCPVC